MRGLLGQAHQSTNAMFHEIFGNPVFGAAIQGIDLNFLIAHILLDDHTTRPTLSNTIDLQLFAKFLKNLTKTVGNF